MALILPATGHHLTQPFDGQNINEAHGYIVRDSHGAVKGRRISGIGSYQAHAHLALDYGMPTGTPLKACQAGLVVAKGTILRFADGSLDGEHYIIVRIRKNATTQTLYLYTHLMDKWPVAVGTRVKQGQVIAYSDNSGRSTGPHLHWELAVLPATALPSAFWNKRYYRYNPLRFLATGDLAGSSLIIPN